MSDRGQQRERAEHSLSICDSFTGRQWVECSCGWSSPDLSFPTGAEAIAWARKEHGIARQVLDAPSVSEGESERKEQPGEHWILWSCPTCGQEEYSAAASAMQCFGGYFDSGHPEAQMERLVLVRSQPQQITEEMVRAAADVIWDEWSTTRLCPWTRHNIDDVTRQVLRAALGEKEGER